VYAAGSPIRNCFKKEVTENAFGIRHFRAVQWHYIDKLSNVTVPNHTFITTHQQALFIYKRPKITG